jgi:exonuclease SbcD
MKIFHLSDLHIGKIVHDYNMLEDQAFALEQVLNLVDQYRPDAVIIAGDVYDKSIPSAEAVKAFDRFLTRLSRKAVTVFIISGNHDSAERLNFASSLLTENAVYISGVFEGEMKKKTLKDAYGNVNFYLLPFIKPIDVRMHYHDETIENYNDAVRKVVENTQINPKERNLLVAHQFITGASQSDSEISVGTLDQVDDTIFDRFDYVALGHLHRPQRVGRDTIRYCGTPVAYSFSEAGDKKSVTMVTFGADKVPKLEFLQLKPLHEMLDLEGSMEEILKHEKTEAYTRVTLTDDAVIIDAIGKLKNIFPRLMTLGFKDRNTNSSNDITDAKIFTQKSELELFCDFYEEQTGSAMNEEDIRYMKTILQSLGGVC